MAEDKEDISPIDVERDEEEGYQPPPEKSIDEILEADQVLEGLGTATSSCSGLDMRGGKCVVKSAPPFLATCPALPSLAMPCPALPCSALPCTVLHCPARFRPALPFIALHCTVLSSGGRVPPEVQGRPAGRGRGGQRDGRRG